MLGDVVQNNPLLATVGFMTYDQLERWNTQPGSFAGLF